VDQGSNLDNACKKRGKVKGGIGSATQRRTFSNKMIQPPKQNKKQKSLPQSNVQKKGREKGAIFDMAGKDTEKGGNKGTQTRCRIKKGQAQKIRERTSSRAKCDATRKGGKRGPASGSS